MWVWEALCGALFMITLGTGIWLLSRVFEHSDPELETVLGGIVAISVGPAFIFMVGAVGALWIQTSVVRGYAALKRIDGEPEDPTARAMEGPAMAPRRTNTPPWVVVMRFLGSERTAVIRAIRVTAILLGAVGVVVAVIWLLWSMTRPALG
jgi:hypothetical protein